MLHRPKPFWRILVLVTLFGSLGFANSPAPERHELYLYGDDVYFCPWSIDEAQVPLRENIETGEVVELSNEIVPNPVDSDSWNPECFVDHCVEAGVYRYGYEEKPPYWAESYDEIEIADSPVDDCASMRNVTPADPSRIPWSKGDEGTCNAVSVGRRGGVTPFIFFLKVVFGA